MGSGFEGGSRTRETRVKHVVGGEVCGSQGLLPVRKVSERQSALLAGRSPWLGWPGCRRPPLRVSLAPRRWESRTFTWGDVSIHRS